MNIRLLACLFLLLTFEPVFCAIDFDGVDDYVELGDVLNVTGTSISAAAWVNRTNAAKYLIFLGRNKASGPPTVPLQYQFTWVNTTDPVPNKLRLDFTDGTNLIQSNSTGTFTDTGIWHHIAITYDGANVRFYFDGALDSSVAQTASIVSIAGATTRIGTDTPRDTGYTDAFIDDVRLYNRVLSAGEVATLYNSRLRGNFLDSGLIGYWTLNDGEDETSADGDRIINSVSADHGTGVDGANNTGLTWQGESANLSYPPQP